MAEVYGSEKYPMIHGTVSFYQVMAGTIVVTEIFGLPSEEDVYKRQVQEHLKGERTEGKTRTNIKLKNVSYISSFPRLLHNMPNTTKCDVS